MYIIWLYYMVYETYFICLFLFFFNSKAYMT